ncbi:MAG: hypothetical protein WAM09_05560 [Anaerolineales bacterium]
MEINNPSKCCRILLLSRDYFKVKFFGLLILMLFLMMSMSGCVTLADFDASQEYASDTVGVIDAQTNLGQSFVSRRPNLNGITIWLTPASGQTSEPTSANIIVKLFLAPGESKPEFSTTIIAPDSGNNIPITINIPNQKNLGGQNYFLLLTTDSGSIQINGRNEDAYPHGQAYVNENGVNADIAFRLSYNYDFLALLRDIKQFSASIWIAAPLFVVLWLPGWLLLELSGLRSHFDFGEQSAISIGFSLVSIPVVMLWTMILKIKWTRGAVFFVAGFLIAFFIVRLIYKVLVSQRNHPKPDRSQTQDQPTLPKKIITFFISKSFALILIFLVSLAVRLIMVRDLATPAWVDSVHHALITRIILDTGSYPSTYLPYWDMPATSYHPGFHSIAATFTWLANLDLDQSLLILGQVLNAMSVFSVYLITKSLTRSASAGLFAGIITGFLTPMPAYYTSWGRYTELTGLLVLPVVLALIQLWMDGKVNKRISMIIPLGAITAGGIFMIHYRVIVFLACLIFSFVIFHIVVRREGKKIEPARLLLFVITMTVLGIISVFPWLIQTLKTTILPIVNTVIDASVPFFQDFSWPYLTSALGKQALVLAGLGLVWAVIKQRSFPFILTAWILLLFLFANFNALKLPGANLISNSSVEIMLFLPISILGGYFIDQILIHWIGVIPKEFIIPSLGIIFIIFGSVTYLGAMQLVTIINPITILSRNADLPAIEWISEHIPENETIVINPFAWGYGLYAGSDGGYWISPLSGRVTLPPPVLYGLGSGADNINQKSQDLISLSPDPIAFSEFLHTNHLHYIYIGAKGGVISPENLVSSGLFTVHYQLDGVWILEVKP